MFVMFGDGILCLVVTTWVPACCWKQMDFVSVITLHQMVEFSPELLCNAVTCPHLERSGMGTACSRSASAPLYHADSRLTPCDGAVVC